MTSLRYHLSTIIGLHLETYYSQGITPEKAKEIIEGIHDFGTLRCKDSRINNNWDVQVNTHNFYKIECIVEEIAYRLNLYLKDLQKSEDS